MKQKASGDIGETGFDLHLQRITLTRGWKETNRIVGGKEEDAPAEGPPGLERYYQQWKWGKGNVYES